MHVGKTSGPDIARPLLTFARWPGRWRDVSPDGRVSPAATCTGCLRPTRRAQLFLRSFGARHRAKATKRSIDDVLDRFAEHLGAARRYRAAAHTRKMSATTSNDSDHDRPCRAAQDASAARMSAAVGLAPAVAHVGVFDQRGAVGLRTVELQTQRAGHRAFRPAGIRRTVLRRVAPHRARARSPAKLPARAQAASCEQQPRQSRRRKIDEIVEPRRRPAERLMPRRAMADHAVRRVDGFVGGKPGQARERRTRTPARRRRRTRSRQGSRSPRAQRHVRRAFADCGRRCGRRHPARRRDRSIRARARRRGRDRKDSACDERRRHDGERELPDQTRCQRAFDDPADTGGNYDHERRASTRPRFFGRRQSRTSRFSRRSSLPMSAPIQVTGWPIVR